MSAHMSKEALIFQNRIVSLKKDLELIDVICAANKEEDFLSSAESLFQYMQAQHIELHKRRLLKKSRQIVITHLRKTVYSSYILKHPTCEIA